MFAVADLVDEGAVVEEGFGGDVGGRGGWNDWGGYKEDC